MTLVSSDDSVGSNIRVYFTKPIFLLCTVMLDNARAGLAKPINLWDEF